MKLIFVCLSRL